MRASVSRRQIVERDQDKYQVCEAQGKNGKNIATN